MRRAPRTDDLHSAHCGLWSRRPAKPAPLVARAKRRCAGRTAATRTTTRRTSPSAQAPPPEARTTNETGPAGGARTELPPALPIPPLGDARIRKAPDTAYAGIPPHGVARQICGYWSHRSPLTRPLALARAHARGSRAGRPGSAVPVGAL